jgi:acetate kinase
MTRGRTVAVINCGSSSIKYDLFNVSDSVKLASGLVEKIGGADSHLRQRRRQPDGTFEERNHRKPLANHREGFDWMASVNQGDPIIDESELFGIGHRVVHGGEVFRAPTVIDDAVIAAIRELISLAPLHNPANLLGIEVARARFPAVPQVAVFDTAFHQTLPPRAYHYAVPYDWYTEHHVRRYGFHGTSHAYVAGKTAQHLGQSLADLNLITLHLGNGASAAALQGGRSIDTSMGMTPIEGLVMGTRCGDTDPALPFYVLRQMGMSADDIEGALNTASGLKGICGVSDMREILDRVAKGDDRADLAIDVFCYRIKKYIGGYIAVLGRVDAIVFTGGIGENAPPIRQRVCEGLEHLGIVVDRTKNTAPTGEVADIHEHGAPVRVLVVPTDEEWEIAQQSVHAIENATR